MGKFDIARNARSIAEAELTRRLWLEGKSATEVSKSLVAAGYDRTRNSVIGWIHRSGLNRDAPKRTNEGSRVRQLISARVRKQKSPPAPTLEVKPVSVKKPVNSPNARHWTLRCDSPDDAECAFLIDDKAIACCNPVPGGGPFGRRYCAGHLETMLDIGAMERARTKRGVFTRPDTIRRNSTVLTTVWDEGRGPA